MKESNKVENTTSVTPEQEILLCQIARQASERAYCPYSGFPVGAAALTASGDIFSGCNIENASFGLTVCAERNAIFQAIDSGRTSIVAIAIFTPTEAPTAPCGACRQVIREFAAGTSIICCCNSDLSIRSEIAELLPISFGPDNLAT